MTLLTGILLLHLWWEIFMRFSFPWCLYLLFFYFFPLLCWWLLFFRSFTAEHHSNKQCWSEQKGILLLNALTNDIWCECNSFWDTRTLTLVYFIALFGQQGFFGFLYTLVWVLLTLYGALVTLSVTHPSSAKALVSFDEAWTRSICLINLMLCLGSFAMLPFASSFKGDKSTNDPDGFGFFIWALYLLLLALIPEYFLTLHVYLHIPKSTVWSFGTAIFSFDSVRAPYCLLHWGPAANGRCFFPYNNYI